MMPGTPRFQRLIKTKGRSRLPCLSTESQLQLRSRAPPLREPSPRGSGTCGLSRAGQCSASAAAHVSLAEAGHRASLHGAGQERTVLLQREAADAGTAGSAADRWVGARGLGSPSCPWEWMAVQVTCCP